MSTDLARESEPLERLPTGVGPGLASPRVLLLRVRHTDDTLDSCSDLLFSRAKVPNPNFLRKEEVLLVSEAELADLVRLCELKEPVS